MKPFTPRERLGLIILAIIVAGCFFIESLVDLAGCKRVGGKEEVDMPAGGKVTTSDSVNALGTGKSEWLPREERSKNRQRSDSVRQVERDSARSYRRSDGSSYRSKNSHGAKKSSSGKSKKKDKSGSPSGQRSLRDEKL